MYVPLAGSRYWQSGSFEVTKSDTEVVETQESLNGSSHSAMRVTVLTELEGVAYIQVTIRDSTNVGAGNGKIWGHRQLCMCFFIFCSISGLP